MSSLRYSLNPSMDIPSLEGKVILITGANTGLGKRTAMELAKHNPSHVWMTARDASKGATAVEEVSAMAPNVQISLLEVDLASFASIKSAAKRFLAQSSRLDILYLNAGILCHPQALTQEGFEIHMGVNHLGHALLLKLLTPLLLKTAKEVKADVRVVSLTSVAWKYCPETGIPLSALRSITPSIPPTMRYIHSKLAIKLYAASFAANHPQLKTVAIHPGEVKTDLFEREAGDEQVAHLQNVVAPSVAVPIEQGVRNQLWAGTAQDVVNGKYYEPVGIPEERTEAPATVEVAGASFGTGSAQGEKREEGRMLWEWTQEALAKCDCSEETLRVQRV